MLILGLYGNFVIVYYILLRPRNGNHTSHISSWTDRLTWFCLRDSVQCDEGPSSWKTWCYCQRPDWLTPRVLHVELLGSAQQLWQWRLQWRHAAHLRLHRTKSTAMFTFRISYSHPHYGAESAHCGFVDAMKSVKELQPSYPGIFQSKWRQGGKSWDLYKVLRQRSWAA